MGLRKKPLHQCSSPIAPLRDKKHPDRGRERKIKRKHFDKQKKKEIEYEERIIECPYCGLDMMAED